MIIYTSAIRVIDENELQVVEKVNIKAQKSAPKMTNDGIEVANLR